MQKHFKSIRIALTFVFFTAIIVSFSDIKGNIPYGFYLGTLYLQFIPSVLKFLTTGTIISIGFLLVLLVTIIGGRIYCSTICPLGILQDIVIFFRRKITLKHGLKFKKPLNILRYSLLAITIISFAFSGILFLNLLDPYAIFGRIASHIYQALLLFINNVIANLLPSIGLHVFEARPVHWESLYFALGMLFLVSVLSIFRGRLYCNSICPLGTFLGLLSKLSIFKIMINDSSCTRCGNCQTACKANCINIKTLEIDETRCISCYDCISVCNVDSIGYRKALLLNRNNHTEKTNSRRRFFLAAATTYLASKTIPSIALDNNHIDDTDRDSVHVCYFSKGPVTPPGAKSLDNILNQCIACHLCVSVHNCPKE